MMYNRNIAKNPIEITREEFLTSIFDFGRFYEYGYDTIVGAVELADRFMLIEGTRNPYDNTEPISQIYSKELAIVTLTLAGKSNEDDSRPLKYGFNFCENHYMVKMEWELCMCFQYHIKVNNFITYIGLVFSESLKLETGFDEAPKLGTNFGELAMDICRLPKWWEISPLTVTIGSLLLYKRNKLRAVITDKEKQFKNSLQLLAKEFELPIQNVVKTYITIK